MKKTVEFFFLVTLLVLFFGCGNKEKIDKNRVQYAVQMKGINLVKETNAPNGTIGVPDISLSDDAAEIFIYPKPTNGILHINFWNKTGEGVLFEAIIEIAEFKDGPKDAVIENLKERSRDTLYHTINLYGHPNSTVVRTFDLTHLPQGFYRFTIVTANGQRYWDNMWIKR